MKMANVRTKVAVGSFVLIAIALAVVGVLIVGDGIPGFRENRTFEIIFRDAAGLQEGAPVKMGGLQIGRVTSLHLQFVDDAPAAVAAIEVKGPEFDMIRVDTEAILQTQGVLGDKFVVLSGGAANSAVAADGAKLHSAKQMTIDEMMQRADRILGSFESILENINSFTDGLPDGQTVADSVRNLTETTGYLSKAAHDLSKPGGLISIMSDPAAGSQVAQSIGNFERAGRSIETITDRIEHGQGSLGLLVNDPTLYDETLSLLGRTNRNKIARSLIREAIRSKDSGEGVITH